MLISPLEISLLTPLSFDALISEIGYGKYQFMILLALCPVAIADGTEAFVLSILIPIFENEWYVTSFQLSILGTLVFLGYLIGSFIAGPIADKYGRRYPLIISTGIWTIFALLSSMAYNIYDFMFYRFIFGIVVGFVWPVAYSLLTEYCPIDKRGIFLNIFQIVYPIGELLAVFIAYFTLRDLSSGNWRALLGFSTIPAAFSFIFCVFFVDESARFQFQVENFDDACEILKKVARINGKGNNFLTQEKIDRLEHWNERFREFSPELQRKGPPTFINNINNFYENSKSKISQLFLHGYKKTTIIIWISWFSNTFIYYGVSFIIPLTLVRIGNDVGSEQSTKDEQFVDLAISNIGELLSCAFCAILVDFKFLGRKYSLVISTALCGFCTIPIFLNFGPNFIFWVSILRFLAGLVNCINYLYTSEIYPTKIRATGMGMASSLCRIAPMIVPWIAVYLTDIYIFLPYLVFGFIGGISAVFIIQLEHETLGKELDYLI